MIEQQGKRAKTAARSTEDLQAKRNETTNSWDYVYSDRPIIKIFIHVSGFPFPSAVPSLPFSWIVWSLIDNFSSFQTNGKYLAAGKSKVCYSRAVISFTFFFLEEPFVFVIVQEGTVIFRRFSFLVKRIGAKSARCTWAMALVRFFFHCVATSLDCVGIPIMSSWQIYPLE